MVTSRTIFFIILAIIFFQRIIEGGQSKRNVAALHSKGGQEISTNSLALVIIMQLSWFAAMILEVCFLNRTFHPLIGTLGIIGAITGQVLRFSAMRALKERWTLPLVVLPNTPVVDQGVYRYVRHPNWLGVIIEIASVPLIHTAYLTAIIYSLLNAFVIGKRVKIEEQALSAASNYQEKFANKARFIPGIF